jgi:hypothetical protein
MAITTTAQEVAKLRSYLNPLIRGKNTDAVLYALASGFSSYLVNTADNVQQQMYLATAQSIFLDRLAAEFNVTRPPQVGVGDDEFRQIAIQIKNLKAIRTLINSILNIIYGDQLTKASAASSKLETYALADQDTLILSFDNQAPVTIIFNTNQFSNIGAALAQEVADAITTNLSAMALDGYAVMQDDGNGPYVRIYSNTVGPASAVTILGGSAQNVLVFPAPVGAGGNLSTQWTLTEANGGAIRFTWTGGANPNLGKLSVGNYVNIYGGGFASSSNVGSYTITGLLGGAQDSSYFEVYNPLGTPGIVVQGNDNAVLFFNPEQQKVTSQTTYAAQFQVSPRTVQVFIPAITKVVRRTRQGSAHLNDDAFAETLAGQPGPYLYDLTQPFTISKTSTSLTQNLSGADPKLISVADSSDFPDAPGYLIFGYGTAEQEGPVPYIATPSSTTILISPAYTLKNSFLSGANVILVETKAQIVIATDGSNFDFILTGDSAGKNWCIDLINQISATGLNIIFTVIFPSDIGLGKFGTPFSEITTVYGQ